MISSTDLDFCLLIPCYNNWEGLRLSLQTVHYRPNLFLIVVVDDGSDRPVRKDELVDSRLDLPIHVIRLEQNKGITHALNAGLAWITGNVKTKYIARLDCSDECHRDRFYKQVAFLDAHPSVGLLGSWCVFKDRKSGESFQHKAPGQDADIRKAMHLRNVFIHPTVMWRADLLAQVGAYRHDFPHAEDYAFFWALLKHTKGAILDEFLVTCAITAKGISGQNRQQQLLSCGKVIRAYGEIELYKKIGLLQMRLRSIVPQKVIFLLKKWRSDQLY